MTKPRTVEFEARREKHAAWHTVAPGQTIYSLARDVYGMVHWQQIWNHEKNQGLRTRCLREGRDLFAGDILYIPPHQPFEGALGEPGGHYRFKIRSYEPMPSISQQWAKRCAETCASEAYADVEQERSLLQKVKHGLRKGPHLVQASWHNATHYKVKRKLARAGVAIVFATAVPALVGLVFGSPIALSIAIAIAGTGWAAKKVVDGTLAHYENEKVKQAYNDNVELAQLWSGKDHRELRDSLTEDAAGTLRKAILHLGLARRTQTKHKLPKLAGSTDKEVGKYARACVNFVHDLNKARLYLLPSIGTAVFFIDVYMDVAERWAKERQSIEDAMVNFMGSGHHEACADAGEHKCYRAAHHHFEMVNSEEMLVKGDKGRDAGRPTPSTASKNQGYTGEGRYAQVSVESIDPDRVRKLLIETTEDQRSRVANLTKLRARVDGERKGRQRDIFLTALGFAWREREHKTGHWFRNYRLSHTHGEFAMKVVDELLAVGVGAFSGGVFKPLVNSQTTSAVLRQAATAGLVAANQGFVGGGNFFTFKSGAKKDMMMHSDLLKYSEERVRHSVEHILKGNDASEKEMKEKDFRRGVVVVERLFKKVAYHYKKAHTAADEIEGEEIVFQSCSDCFEFAKRLYAVHHHMDKMERYLVACISVILEVQAWINVLLETEENIHHELFDPDSSLAKYLRGKEADENVPTYAAPTGRIPEPAGPMGVFPEDTDDVI